MTLLSEIGQPTFVEVIRVDPFEGVTCEAKVILGNSRWQNPNDRFDINGDGVIDEIDYGVLLQWIGQYGQGVLPALKPDADPWVDVNGDGVVDDKDLQQLANYLAGVRDESDSTCHRVSDFRIERDLLDPAQIIDCTTVPTVRAAACHKNIIPTASYTPYFNLCTGLLETTWDAVIKTKDSIIYVHNDLLIPRDEYFAGCSDTPRVLNRILRRLQADPFPYRYDPNCRVLPDWPDDTSDWKAGDVGVAPDIPDEPILPDEPDLTTTTTTAEPVFGLLARVVIINIIGNAEWYLTTESWYAASSSRITSGPAYGDILWNNGFQASGTHYVDDRVLWDQFIDSISENDSVGVRVGIIHPKGTGEVWPQNRDLPKDSYRDQVDYISFESKSPRISTSNIINAFNIITQNGQFAPTLVIFVTDEAEDNQWASAITAAASQLRNEYPRMEVKKYPFSKPFSRWMMMDLDAMFQLMYQRDNVNNTEISSAYRTTGIEGVIEDPATFQQMRQNHIEMRLVNNNASVNWFEISNDPLESGNVYDLGSALGSVGISKGRTSACYAILNPFGWSISSQLVDTGTPTSRPQRADVRFTSNPYFIFQQDSTENGIYSLNYLWAARIVEPTIYIVDPGGSGFRTFLIYAHATATMDTASAWHTDYFGGIQRDIRVDAYISSSRQSVVGTISGRTYQSPEDVVDVFPVTHLNPAYGGVMPRSGYYVSIWYNDLHAVVTEGTIRGPRTKDHFVASELRPGDTRGVILEERQRSIAVYSDPDFQDKIYDAVKYFFEANSRFASLRGGRPGSAFNIWGWTVYNNARLANRVFWPWERPGLPGLPPIDFPLLEPTFFDMQCPQYPVQVT